MIIYPNGSFVTNLEIPNGNFADDEHKNKVLVIDDNSELGQKITNGEVFNVSTENEVVTDVKVIQKPIEIEGKEIKLQKNDLGEWEYIYVDVPKTEIEIQQDIINTLGQELAMLKLQFMIGGM